MHILIMHGRLKLLFVIKYKTHTLYLNIVSSIDLCHKACNNLEPYDFFSHGTDEQSLRLFALFLQSESRKRGFNLVKHGEIVKQCQNVVLFNLLV